MKLNSKDRTINWKKKWIIRDSKGKIIDKFHRKIVAKRHLEHLEKSMFGEKYILEEKDE
jgi:hypothetical protein